MDRLEKQVKEGKSGRNPTGVSHQMGTAAERTNLGLSRNSKNKLLSAAFHGCSVTKVPEDVGGNCLSRESTRQEAKSELLTGTCTASKTCVEFIKLRRKSLDTEILKTLINRLF